MVVGKPGYAGCLQQANEKRALASSTRTADETAIGPESSAAWWSWFAPAALGERLAGDVRGSLRSLARECRNCGLGDKVQVQHLAVDHRYPLDGNLPCQRKEPVGSCVGTALPDAVPP